MIRFFSLLFMLSLFQILNAQGLIIDDTATLKKGIYRSFEEFKYNKPSLEFDYTLNTKNKGYGFLAAEGIVTYHRIDIEKKEAKEIGEVYGFCDGRNIYITGLEKLSPKTLFMKLTYVGRFCCYEGITSSFVYTGMGASTTTIEYCDVALDIIDGKTTILSKSSLRELIKSDTLLIEKFNNQKQKGKYLKKYLIEYSNGNYSDIEKHREAQLLNIETLMFNYKMDSTYEGYYSRMLRYEENLAIIELEFCESKNKNGQFKYVGFKARHNKGVNEDYFYKIGTWRYFYKNGQLKEVVNYDFREDKHGLYIKYSETGEVLIESNYIHGDEQ